MARCYTTWRDWMRSVAQQADLWADDAQIPEHRSRGKPITLGDARPVRKVPTACGRRPAWLKFIADTQRMERTG
jgi:hypothetical protein